MSVRDGTTLDNWLTDPYPRRSFQRVREFAPTARIANDTHPPRILEHDPREIEHVEFEGLDGAAVTVADQLARSQAEGLCVLKDGRIAYERYFNGMTERTPHLLMSVSKSWCCALLGVQVGKGLLRRSDLVTDIVPDMAGTSLDGATVAHVVDMTAGTEFVEDYDLYADPDADNPLLEYERHTSYRRLGDREPIGALGHFRTYPTAYEHGAWFDYRSPLTNIQAHMVEAVTGRRFHEVLSEELWGPLGQEFDADIMLDPLGFPIVDGGMSCSLRDLARLGQAYLDDGRAGDAQVIPAEWVRDTREGDDECVRQFQASPTLDQPTKGDWSMYRNAFWVIRRGEVLSGLGIHGQYCYVDRPAGVVIARLSTYPLAWNEAQSAETMRSLAAIAAHLA